MQSTLSDVPPKNRLSRYTRQTPTDSSEIKITAELKNNIIKYNFGNAIYQTIAIFRKNSGSPEWEPISSNSERYIV